jgi:hypothetical protein
LTERLNRKDAQAFLGVGSFAFKRIARERGWVAERGRYGQSFYSVQDLKTFRPDGKVAIVEKPPKTRDRACLRCRKTFPSAGAHNRLCEGCNDYARTVRSNFDE